MGAAMITFNLIWGADAVKQTFVVFSVVILLLSLVLPGNSAVYAEGETTTYVVNFKGNGLPSNAESVIEEAGGTVLSTFDALSGARVASDDPHFLERIRGYQEVSSAGKELEIVQDAVIEGETVEASGNHSLYEQYQWDIKQVTQNGESFDLPNGRGTKDVVVAVIDTGIDLEHPDLKDNIVDAQSFVPGEDAMDYNSHGTHVAGSVAANGHVLGVGPELGIASLKVFPRTGGAATSWIVDAIQYSVDQDYDVINMSLGSHRFLQDPNSNTADIIANINLFKQAIAYAYQNGVTVVGSAGNAAANITSPGQLTRYLYDDNGATIRNPAGQHIIRVSAGNSEKELAFYSNYGVGKIDVMAPGGDLGPNYDPETGAGRDHTYLCLSTVPVFDAQGNPVGHGYGWKAGTSMAAPKVAAVAGLIISKHGKNNLKPNQVKQIIHRTAEDVYKPGRDAESGYGLTNAVNALEYR
jgi:subtilisin family serine protease